MRDDGDQIGKACAVWEREREMGTVAGGWNELVRQEKRESAYKENSLKLPMSSFDEGHDGGLVALELISQLSVAVGGIQSGNLLLKSLEVVLEEQLELLSGGDSVVGELVGSHNVDDLLLSITAEAGLLGVSLLRLDLEVVGAANIDLTVITNGHHLGLDGEDGGQIIVALDLDGLALLIGDLEGIREQGVAGNDVVEHQHCGLCV